MLNQEPYKREETTLREIKNNPAYKGWYMKVTDGEEPFVVPMDMFFSQYSENNPLLDEEQTAYKNERGDVTLLWTGYNCSPVITLMNLTAAQGYLYSNELLG